MDKESLDKATIERREAPRAPVRTEIRIYYPDLRRLADEICRDISVGGMFVEAAAPPAVGTEIRFDLFLPIKKPQVMHGEGVVTWSRPSDTASRRTGGFGVKFLKLDPVFRQMIFRVVDHFIQRGGDPFDLDLEGEQG
ncbi:MAG: PilZ domain-containing protein [Thermoanaerobaculia bacterium]